MKSLVEFLSEKIYWGNSAAGCIIVAKDTKRILFLLRSGEEDSEAGQWEMTIGGKKDPEDNDSTANVEREIEEEIGVVPNEIETKLVEIFIDSGENHEDFKYHVYAKLVKSEFKPVLSDEHSDFKWVDIYSDLPSPLHFGAERLLKSQKVLDLVK